MGSKRVGKFLETKPVIDKTSFIANGAVVKGKIKIGKHSSIWYGVSARADINFIKIGDYTNIQDGSVLHVDDDLPLYVGDYVTVGHNVILHGCRVGSYSLIGMGSIILNDAEIGKGAKVAAGALVCEGFKVPDYTLVMGMPARVKRDLTKEERKESIYWARKYAKLAQEYKSVYS